MLTTFKKVGLAFGVSAMLAGCHGQMSSDIADPHANPTPGLTWSHDPEAALTRAKQDGQPVLITFYSNNCGWCREFERTTLADPKVQLAANRFALVRLNVDEATEFAQKYNVPGVPYTVLLKPNGDMAGRIIGYVDAEAFLQKLREVQAGGSIVKPGSSKASE